MLVSREYPVSPAELLQVLTGQAFLDARNEKFGGTAPSTVDRSTDSIVVVTPRQLPLDKVPATFKSFIGSGELVQTDTWVTADGDQSGTWSTDVGGAPVKVSGTHRITATPNGSEYAVDATVKSSIPFIGGAVESQVAGYLKHLLTGEQEFLADYLAGNK